MVIPGYSDIDFMDRIVVFIGAINMSDLNESERELLFSEPLRRDPVTRRVQDFMNRFTKDWSNFLEKEAQLYMKRLAEVCKLRFGKQRYQQLLATGQLPSQVFATDNFADHSQKITTCQKHGKNGNDAQIKKCLTCQTLHGKVKAPQKEATDSPV